MIYLLSLAFAQSLPFDDSIEKSGVFFVAQLQTQSASILMGDQKIPLLDNGVPPDKIAKDGVKSAFVETTEDIEHEIQILNERNKKIWEGRIPSPPRDQQTWVWIDDDKTLRDPTVKVEFKALAGASQKTSVLELGKKQNYLYIRMGIAILFFFIGWRLRKRKKRTLIRRPPPFAHPTRSNPIQSQQTIHTTPSEHDEEVLALLVAYTPHMNVLLLLSPKSSDVLLQQSQRIGGVFFFP